METIEKLKSSQNPVISKWITVWDSFLYKKKSCEFESSILTKLIGIEKKTGTKIEFLIEKYWHSVPLIYLTIKISINNKKDCVKIGYSFFQGDGTVEISSNNEKKFFKLKNVREIINHVKKISLDIRLSIIQKILVKLKNSSQIQNQWNLVLSN